jgi:hypothetical protein
MMQLLDYSPVPASVVEKIKAVIRAKGPEQQKQAQMAAQNAMLELQLKQAEATETMADAKLKEAKTVSELANLKQDKIEAAMEHTHKMAALALQDAELAETRAKNRQEGDLKVLEMMGQQQEKTDQALLEIVTAIKEKSGPKRVVYDESGGPAGIQYESGEFEPIQFDDEGRVAGLG